MVCLVAFLEWTSWGLSEVDGDGKLWYPQARKTYVGRDRNLAEWYALAVWNDVCNMIEKVLQMAAQDGAFEISGPLAAKPEVGGT